MTKRKKRARGPASTETESVPESEANGGADERAVSIDAPLPRESESALAGAVQANDDETVDNELDIETTVNVQGDMLPFPGRDDLDAPTVTMAADKLLEVDSLLVQRRHLKGLLEALIFASDSPIKPKELAKLASARVKEVQDLLEELTEDWSERGIHLEEVAGGWVFRTSAQYAPFIRDLTKQRPVRLTRAQVETLAILAYRQPITRPEVDDVRGVDSGPVLKLLLERDLVRILGKRDEPGRPLIYGTTTHFLEFFGLKSLKDLPTLREFTELTEESRERYEDELGEVPGEGELLPEEEPLRDEAAETTENETLVASGGADQDALLEEPLGDDTLGEMPAVDEDGDPASAGDEDEDDDDDEEEGDDELDEGDEDEDDDDDDDDEDDDDDDDDDDGG